MQISCDGMFRAEEVSAASAISALEKVLREIPSTEGGVPPLRAEVKPC